MSYLFLWVLRWCCCKQSSDENLQDEQAEDSKKNENEGCGKMLSRYFNTKIFWYLMSIFLHELTIFGGLYFVTGDINSLILLVLNSLWLIVFQLVISPIYLYSLLKISWKQYLFIKWKIEYMLQENQKRKEAMRQIIQNQNIDEKEPNEKDKK